jgi:hypothetical protein
MAVDSVEAWIAVDTDEAVGSALARSRTEKVRTKAVGTTVAGDSVQAGTA